MTNLNTYRAALCAMLSVSGFIFSGAATADPKLGPDFLQTLGVGARAVAMGDAYCAIADDATATFWNPGRLGQVVQKNATLEYRSVFSNGTMQGVPPVPIDSFRRKPLQTSFYSVVWPLGRIDYDNGVGPKGGTIGVSKALGGYLDYEFLTHVTQEGTETEPTIVRDRDNRYLVRNEYTTIAYGRNILLKGGTKLGLGASYFRLQQSQSRLITGKDISGSTETTFPPSVSGDLGRGNGYSLGLSYEIPSKSQNQRMTLGATYRSKTRLHGLSPEMGQAFGKEVPSRVSFGVGYQYENPKNKDWLTLAAEVQSFSSSNNEEGRYIDQRRAITNFHIGAEYLPSVPIVHIPGLKLKNLRGETLYSTPVRVGFRTNKAGNTNIAVDDNVLSAGLAFQKGVRPDFDFSLEPTVEYLTKNHSVGITVTATYFFENLGDRQGR